MAFSFSLPFSPLSPQVHHQRTRPWVWVCVSVSPTPMRERQAKRNKQKEWGRSNRRPGGSFPSHCSHLAHCCLLFSSSSFSPSVLSLLVFVFRSYMPERPAPTRTKKRNGETPRVTVFETTSFHFPSRLPNRGGSASCSFSFLYYFPSPPRVFLYCRPHSPPPPRRVPTT